MSFAAAPFRGGFSFGAMVKVIEVPDDPDFDEMCERYDIPVFDRATLRLIWEDYGWEACYPYMVERRAI